MQTIHITANSRLSQFLKQQLTHFEQGVGLTPQVQTLAQWWQTWHSDALLMGELPAEFLTAQKLSNFEAQLIWESLLTQASEAQDELRLLNPRSTAKQAHQAWLFLQEYLQEKDFENRFLGAETRLWLDLKTAYQAYLTKHHLIDDTLWMQQQLAALTQGVGTLPQQFVLHGFDDLSPNIKRWKDIVENRGAQVLINTVSQTYSQSWMLSALSPKQESQQAALWAVQQWQNLAAQKPLTQLRIGIVAPNVQEVVFDLKWALDQQLVLAGLSEFEAEQPAYNISLGQPLSEVPVVKNALMTLQLLLNPMQTCRYADWSAWLLSSYTLGSQLGRHALDAQLRKMQWATFKWPNLVQKSEKLFTALNGLKRALQTWESLANAMPQKLSLPDFIKQVKECLGHFHWASSQAAGALNSVEFQQAQAFRQALDALTLIKTPFAQQTASAWLSLLKQYVAELVHQPQSTRVQPIQILGMLEAGGQQFDALWVMGLTDQAWPRMPQPNPFIPFDLQREYKLPRADAQRELQYALTLTQGFAQAAPEVVWSYAQQVEGASRLPSPLLDAEAIYGSTAVGQLKPLEIQSDFVGLAELAYQQKSAQLWVEDALAPPVPLGQKSPGGTAILAAQNACPLMAFMDYRLGASKALESVEEGLPSTQLGNLIHKVLEELWKALKTQTQLLALYEEQQTAQLQGLIETQMTLLTGQFDAQYLALEAQRILKLLQAWLNLEKQRLPFKVLDNELETDIELAGIRFKIKVDRIDDVNGDWIILDYKTGKASINGLTSERFDAPQLAIYLFAMNALAQKLNLTQPADVAGLGYGILHSDDGVKMNVLLDQDERLVDKRTTGFSLQTFDKISDKAEGEFSGWLWADFLQHLKDEVEKLALSVQQGEAAMVFEKDDDIKFAASYLALRVPEVKTQLGRVSETEEVSE